MEQPQSNGQIHAMEMAERHVDGALASALTRLAGEAVVRGYPRKTRIINEGDQGGFLYLVQSGRVKVFTGDDHGKELVLDYCGPGEIIGEMAMDGGPRCASVVAEEETRCLVIPHVKLREWLRDDPMLAVEIIELLIQRARIATRRAKELALANVYNRVTRLLMDLADIDEAGRLKVREPLSQKNIADRIGCSRDMVNRVFKELTKGGYLLVDRRDITILKKFPAEW